MSRWGRQNWWPADSPFEVAVGAVLVQNTAWRNADLAITNLRAAGLLNPFSLTAISAAELETLIRPAGFQRQKSQTLLGLAKRGMHNTDSFEQFLARPVHAVREDLLALRGIGPETADSILLYAAGHEVFVVDVYLRRFLAGLDLERWSRAKYEHLQLVVEKIVREREAEFRQRMTHSHQQTPSHPPTPMSLRSRSSLAGIYNELHAVLVREGVEKRRPGAYAPGRKLDS